MNWEKYLLEQLKRDEGFRSKPYKCSAGVWTIGYGHTHGITRNTPPIPQDIAEDILFEDMQIAIDDARAVCPCFNSLDPARKVVLSNMAFNLGRQRLAGFKNTLGFICAGDYKQAALNMLKSKWATQVGQRAVRLANIMSTGKLP